MAATFNWMQYNGSNTAETTLGTGGNLFNFKTTDTPGTAGYDTNPITAGNNSFEVYLKGEWTGSFNSVDNLRFWMSTDFSPNDGLSVNWCPNGTTGYAEPVTAGSTVADTSVPESDPESENLYIGGESGGSATSDGDKSDYCVLQLQTTTAAAAGDTSLAEFTLELLRLIAVMLFEKFLKLRETLIRQSLLAYAVTRRLIETIRSETQRRGRSTTIIGKSLVDYGIV